MSRHAIGETPESPIDRQQALNELGLQLRAFDLTPEQVDNVLHQANQLEPKLIAEVNRHHVSGYAGTYHLSITLEANGRFDLKVFDPTSHPRK